MHALIHRGTRTRAGAAAAALTIGVVALTGCGSSKPAYCSQLSELQDSVHELGSISSVSSIGPALKKVESSAKGLAGSVKNEYSGQISAVESSLTKLEGSVQAFPTAESKVTATTQVLADVSAVGTAVKELADAAGSKCK